MASVKLAMPILLCAQCVVLVIMRNQGMLSVHFVLRERTPQQQVHIVAYARKVTILQKELQRVLNVVLVILHQMKGKMNAMRVH